MKATYFILFFLVGGKCFSQQWDNLGSGLSNFSGTTAMFNDTTDDMLYVGGPFTEVDNKTIWGMASWSNTGWDSLLNGIDHYNGGPFPPGNTWGIVRLGNFIYVGGGFIKAGNVFSRYLARWNGTAWDSIPGGQPNNVVDDVIVYNNELYICGIFDSVGSVPANGLARWDGAQWHSVGNNYPFAASGYLSHLAFYNGSLFVSGVFDDPLSLTCRLAKWDFSNWQFLTSEITGSIVDVHSLQVYNNELYIGGLFYSSAGNPGNCIVRWNDTTMRDVGGSVSFSSFSTPQVRDMVVHAGKLYCTGSFEKVGGITAMGLASWDGYQWCGYNTNFATFSGQYCGPSNLEFYHDTLYVGGGFSLVNGDSAISIAKWIGGAFLDTCGVINVSIEDFELGSACQIFPNPAKEEIFIGGHLPDNSYIRISNLIGQSVIETEIPTGEQSTHIESSLPEGVYIYCIFSHNELLKTGKIIIQN